MPVIPGAPVQAPYDEVETILTFARVIANDAGITIAGNLLSDTQPYVFPMLNLAWRKLQDRLSNNAIESFPQEAIITNLPAQSAAAFSDPAIQAYLDFNNYFDGSGYNPVYQLPQDMEIPLRLWERVTGQSASFIPMFQTRDGIPANGKGSYLRLWEWRDDKIYFAGANQNLDLRIRYRKILSDVSTTNESIPLIRCAVALAYLMVEIFATSRGSLVLPSISQQGEDAIKQLINQTSRKKQRNNYRRQPYSRRARMW